MFSHDSETCLQSPTEEAEPEKVKRVQGPRPDSGFAMLGVPVRTGSDSLVGRGLSCAQSPGGPLEDELPVGVAARLGWLAGLSGRELSRLRGG